MSYIIVSSSERRFHTSSIVACRRVPLIVYVAPSRTCLALVRFSHYTVHYGSRPLTSISMTGIRIADGLGPPGGHVDESHTSSAGMRGGRIKTWSFVREQIIIRDCTQTYASTRKGSRTMSGCFHIPYEIICCPTERALAINMQQRAWEHVLAPFRFIHNVGCSLNFSISGVDVGRFE